MTRDEILTVLKAAEPRLRSRGVAHAALFGSVARGEEGPESDIDIMVKLDSRAEIGLYGYVAIVNFIKGLFPSEVDVANRACLRPFVRPTAELEALYAF